MVSLALPCAHFLGHGHLFLVSPPLHKTVPVVDLRGQKRALKGVQVREGKLRSDQVR